MYRFIAAVLLMLGTAVAAFAADGPSCMCKWKLSVSGGYATVDMKDVNNDYEALPGRGGVTKVANGWLGAAEGMYEVSSHIGLGLRVEYLKTNQGKYSFLTREFKEDLSIVPVMVGARYRLKRMSDTFGGSFCDNCGLNLGLFIGASSAWGQISDGQTIKYQGAGVAGDILLGWEHRLWHNWMVGIDLGYRYAPIDEMKTSEDYPVLGISKNATITDRNGNKLKYDFSGLIATIGVGYKF